MKKIVVLVIIITIILSTISIFSLDEPYGTNSYYIASSEVPKGIIDYAHENYESLIYPMYEEPEKYGLNSSEIDFYKIGEPFSIYDYSNSELETTDVYYFPIIYNDNVKALLSVTTIGENEYVANLGKSFSEDLNYIKGKGNANNPFMVVDVDDDNILIANNDSERVFKYSTEKNINNTNLTKTTINKIKKEIHATKNVVISDLKKQFKPENVHQSKLNLNSSKPFFSLALSASSNVSQKYLGVKPVLQGDHPWCGAACTAAIINYKKNKSLTAKDVTTKVHGYAKEAGISKSDICDVMESYGLSPTRKAPLTIENVKTNINNNKPIYMSTYRKTGVISGVYHGLVLRGYFFLYTSPYTRSYSLMNPWYDYYVTVSAKDSGWDVVYIVGSRKYTWSSSITI